MRASSSTNGARGWVMRGLPSDGFLSRRNESGTILLEVVLALVLFVAAAAIIGAGFSASVDSVERQRLSTHAVNLAVSVLSELQMGIRNAGETGPSAFAVPFEAWTWELILAPVETDTADAAGSTGLTQAEVVIRHLDPPMVYRMAQFLKPGPRGGGLNVVDAQ